jgi:PIN domain nuclease of toxin-antitoxin system
MGLILMRLLLDTHTFVWALTDPDRLSLRAASLIRDLRNTVLVSAASAWEIATKHRLGRLPGAGPVIAAYPRHLTTLRAEELPIRSTHALKAGTFGVDHADPFDRILAAQAILESARLVTNDRALASFPDLDVVW